MALARRALLLLCVLALALTLAAAPALTRAAGRDLVGTRGAYDTRAATRVAPSTIAAARRPLWLGPRAEPAAGGAPAGEAARPPRRRRLRLLYLDPHPNSARQYPATVEALRALHDVCTPGRLPERHHYQQREKYGDAWSKLLRGRCYGDGTRAFDAVVLGWSYTNHAPPPLPLLRDLPGVPPGAAYPPVAAIINKEYSELELKLEWLRALEPRPIVAFSAHHDVRRFSQATGVPFVRVPPAVDDDLAAVLGGGSGGKNEYTHDFGFFGRVEHGVPLSNDLRVQVEQRRPELEASGMRVFFEGSAHKSSVKVFTRQVRATKIWLSTTGPANLVSTRVFDIMSTNTTLLFVNGPAPLYEGILEDGVHAVLFNSVDDLLDKVRRYASPEYEAERLRIVGAARRLVEEQHTYRDRAGTITDAILRELPEMPNTNLSGGDMAAQDATAVTAKTEAITGAKVEPLSGSGGNGGSGDDSEVTALWARQRAEAARRAGPGRDPGEFGHGGGAPDAGSGCPKVFVYDLPPNVTEITNAHTLSKVFGPEIDKKHKWLRETEQWALAQLVLNRLMRPGAECRTTDPSQADLFLVPALTKPKGSSDWMAACAKFDGKALVASLPHLNARTACRHVFLISKGHYKAERCVGWLSYPAAPLHCASRVAYSYFVTAEQLALDSSFFPDVGTHPAAYPYLHSVPYPASVHWPPKGGAAPGERPPWERQSHKDRPILMLFTGTATHGDVPVRKLIQKMCNGYKDISVCTFKSFTRESASLKAKARFCLEPGGDSPFRKSISDSLAMGCVPVVFSNITAEVAPWHWGGWRALGQLHVPRVDFLAGRYDLAAMLRAQPEAMSRASAAAVAANGKKWMFASDDSVEDDAFKVLLKGVARAARKQCQECDPAGKPPPFPASLRGTAVV